MIKKALAALVFALMAIPASAQSSGCAGTGCVLPATCTAGTVWGQHDAQGLSFYCLGTNTWKPSGNTPVLAYMKGVNLNAANVDIPLTMPGPFRYYARLIRITGATVNLSTTAARVGIWTGAGATGTNIVVAANSGVVLQTLTTPATVGEGNLSVQVTSTLSQVFLRVTVAHGSAAAVDIAVIGDIFP
jgi:hypothetical protein